MRKTFLLIYSLLFLSVPGFAQAEYNYGVMPIFVFGEASAWVGTGFTVGDGSCLVTTADLITEKFTSASSMTIKFPIVVSPYTGNYYRAEVVAKDSDRNLAVLRLVEKGLPAVRFAGHTKELDAFKDVPSVAEKQLLSTQDLSRKWPTVIFGPMRSKKNPLNLGIEEWRAERALACELHGVKWLYLTGISPGEIVPKGSPVVRLGLGIVGMFGNKVEVSLLGGGKETKLEFGQCLPTFEMVPLLKKVGLLESDIYQGALPAGERDKSASEAFKRICRAFSFIKSGKWKQAVENTKALVELRPESAKERMLLGVALAGGGENDEALKSLDKAAEINPKLPGLLLNRAEVLFALQKDKEAEEAYRKAIEESPTEIRSILRLSKLLSLDKARSAEAIALARKAVGMEPNSPGAHMSLGLRLKEAGEYDDAAKELNRALSLSPNWAGAHVALAETYRAAGKMTEAEQEYRTSVEDSHGSPAALLDLAFFLSEVDKKDEARKVLADLLKLNPPKEFQEAIDKLKAKLDSGSPPSTAE